jgi:Methyltransferase domain
MGDSDDMRAADHPACRVCGKSASGLWSGPLLDLTVRYMRCSHCEYVQTESPYWLDRAYSNSINDSDTGIMARNLGNCRIVLATLFATRSLRQGVVDFAGGYGILTRLLRDIGVAALWSDPYCANLVARGFEYTGGRAGTVTAFEAFEHFVDPAAELDKMLTAAPNVLFSTQIIPNPVPLPKDWWYYGQDHGQHIGFFTVNTLRLLAESRGRHLLSDGSFYHLITERRLSPSIWRSWLRIQALTPALARRMLKSKTWDDHLRVAGQTAKPGIGDRFG